MEQGLGSNSNANPGSIDKSRVLDVRPLRTLAPVFPNPPGMSSVATPQPTPFTCVPPSGPFPPGIQPFFPFLASDTRQAGLGAHSQSGNFGFGSSIPAPIPLNSFRTPTPQANGGSSQRKRASKARGRPPIVIEDDGYSDSQNQSDQYGSGFSTHDGDADVASNSRKRRGRPRRVAENGEGYESYDIESLVDSFMASFKLNNFDEFRNTNSDKDIVRTILLTFDLIRRRVAQLEEAKDASRGAARRPDLKAGALLMNKGVRANHPKRMGHVPGVEVGDIFFFRMELCIVGAHTPSMAGIDYITMKLSVNEEPMAISIVSSGGYDDNGDDTDVLIYTGHGGQAGKDGKMSDQKLERGNLALEKSLHRSNDVRVIRGIKDTVGVGKIYVYDGLYKIQESWAEKNKSGCNVFKYKLGRVPGQPEAFSLWKSIQQWKDGSAIQPGVILPDLTSGAESQPVTLVNDVDGEKGPAHFTYISSLRYTKPFLLLNIPQVVIAWVDVNQACACPPNCRNRMSQAGVKVHLEVFKTKNRGWGLRSWDPIRAGGFICEYAGDVVKEFTANDVGKGKDDNYIFDATRYYEPLESVRDDSAGFEKSPHPLCVNAKNNGNVARFMNHSCSPNVMWRPVLRELNSDSYLHIAFFAIRHIPPMQELAYDYGIVSPEKGGDKGKKKCLCGTAKCRGYFY
ncbi:histone-lysine N-methyltransferase, H3 lysine-9 specific SUVH1-like [Salvia miltiorrhiza]|uniref:histone-lysine N-methyltransferase, H3 lysine-9 specific SUVH1-like n=1 Tax=Salvia miltiorrhiza TaxID=226208 RepID=UPI0025AC30A3|nr:histone-lysine N-methyltransferase, H3 lysine-9 specific SUVH1-like [Salvia miltiorrhiza]